MIRSLVSEKQTGGQSQDDLQHW